MDTTKPSNMVIASFGNVRNLVGEGKRNVYFFCVSYAEGLNPKLNPINRNPN